MNSTPAHTVRFARAKLATGVHLRYAEAGPRDAPPLLLLHGYTDSWFSFSGIAPALAQRWRVLAPDQRGHGASDRPATGYAVPDLAGDALALLDALGIVEAAVLGHSMGSLVAQELALSAPQRVRALVLAGSAAHFRSPAVRELRDAIYSFGQEVPEPFVREFQLSTLQRPVDEAFLEAVVAESLTVPAHVWRGALEGQLAVDNTARLELIAAPTLVLRGTEDRIFDADAQAAPARRIAGAKEICYPGTGHALHWELPQAVARDVREFLLATHPGAQG